MAGGKDRAKGAGALFTFAVKGGYEACVKLVDHLKLFSHVANLGDTRSLIIHPASTTPAAGRRRANPRRGRAERGAGFDWH